MSSFVFIDSRVQNYERLISGLAADVEVVLLDPGLDGMTQIAAALAGVSDLDSIHVISHGASGALCLGSTVLTGDNLGAYESELDRIGAALSEEGDILLYGCNVGAGAAGESFIAGLAARTGADIAASTDPTGSKPAGGDWTLEAAAGTIETDVVVSSGAQQSYAYLLATGLVITGTSGNDTLTGSTIDDEIYGLGGSDSLDGKGGNDLIYGGAGNDALSGGPGNDTLLGGEGDDTFDLNSSAGDDSLVGGAGDDNLFDNRGRNTLVGGDGADTFQLSLLDPATGGNVATGGTGADLYEVFGSIDLITDVLYDTDFVVTDFATGAEDDRLDVIGLMVLSGRVGGYSGGNPFDQDFLRLEQVGMHTVLEWDPDGAGAAYGWYTAIALNNVTAGNVGMANFVGGLAPGGEAVSALSSTGTANADTLAGGYGNDTLNGVGANDRIFGGAGNDAIDGGTGNDWLDGGLGNDTLLGGDGDDLFRVLDAGGGGYGNDSLNGGIGNDTFNDEWGDNTLVGGDGDDFFSLFTRDPETGSNLVTGGTGRDTYEVFYPFAQMSLALGDELTSTVFLDRDYTVTDFTAGAGGDWLDVTWLLNKSAALGHYASGNPFGSSAFLRLLQWGADTRLQWDPDGAGTVYGWVTVITLQSETATGVTAANIVGGIPTDGAALTNQTFSGTIGNDSFVGGYGDDSISGNTGNDTLLGGGGNDTIVGGPETVAGGTSDNDRLEGNLGNDSITGGAGDDEFGHGGNANSEYGDDTLEGGAGNDKFYDPWGHNVVFGGAGDDYFSTFTFDDGIGSTVATGGAGQDTYDVVPKSTVLGPSVSRIYEVTDFDVGAGGDFIDVDFLLSFAASNGGYSGGSPFNASVGVLRFVQSEADTLLQWDRDGLAGSTHTWITVLTLQGVDRDDITSDNFIGQFIVGTPGNDALVGGLGNDTIQGLAGNDLLDGSLGADSMEGGDGSDVYFVDDPGDLVVETSNTAALIGGASVAALDDFTDTVVAVVSYSLQSAAFVENLTLSDDPTQTADGVLPVTGAGNVLNNIITGNSVANLLRGVGGADTLYGGAGNDTLDGGGASDVLEGGNGNDVYLVNSAGDTVIEASSAGADLVKASVAIGALAANVEKLTLTGSADLNATGNGLANTITGNSGANVLSGGAGADTLKGGAGNDTYVVGAGDVVSETIAGGVDLVKSSIAWTLKANFENLTLTGTNAANAVGNAGDNVIRGNNAANVLAGNGGNDRLEGSGGDDVIRGGTGRDTLTGGAGHDRFEFNTALNATTNVDRIADFSVVDDVIRLDDDIFTALAMGNLAPDAFRGGLGISTAADASDRIIYNETNGNLYYDADGVGGAAATRFAVLTTLPAITAADFLIVG